MNSPDGHGDELVVPTMVDPYHYVPVGDPEDVPRLNMLWNIVDICFCCETQGLQCQCGC